MSVDEVVARWEADEARVRARLEAPDVVPKGQAFNRSGLEVFEAIFAGELPPPQIVGPDAKIYAHATTTCLIFDHA